MVPRSWDHPPVRRYCPFHTMEDVLGTRLSDGSYSFECTDAGHPGGGSFRWLEVPPPKGLDPMSGLAEKLNMPPKLEAAVGSLGNGWFEYGLVERAYATANPDDFAVLLDRWGHTAQGPRQYSASSYIGSVLGRMASNGDLFYRPDRGTGRWSYNHDASYWSVDPEASWEERTTWVSVVGDSSPDAQKADLECRSYVNQAQP